MNKTNYIFNATVIKVVDGDTVDLNIDLGFSVFVKQRIRLNGIDTPEMHSSDPVLREAAGKATSWLKFMLDGKSVTIETFGQEKYGRYLADIFVNGVSVNQKLIEQGYAKAYFGGKKA